MGKVFITTSYKGGVGKSTVAVNLSAGLVLRNYTVLIVDLDSCVRCVDLLLGCESDVLFSFQDFILERVDFEKIITAAELNVGGRIKYVDMVTAPTKISEASFDENKFGNFVKIAKEKYDFVIFDCPPGEFFFLEALCKETDAALIVSDHTSMSLRAAEKSADYLLLNGLEEVRLIINRFNPRGITSGVNLGIIDIIDIVKVQLIGIIEYNSAIKKGQESGKTVYEIKEKTPKKNFEDVVDRILGKAVVLKKKYSGINTKKLHFVTKKK